MRKSIYDLMLARYCLSREVLVMRGDGAGQDQPLVKTEVTWPGEFYYVLEHCDFDVFKIFSQKQEKLISSRCEPE